MWIQPKLRETLSKYQVASHILELARHCCIKRNLTFHKYESNAAGKKLVKAGPEL